ncbi:unnamed protein product, partial [Didymodactylos carnosus]
VTYDVTHTCNLDCGLFILYYIYKTSHKFHNQVTNNKSLAVYEILHSTFDYVDKANWDYARINWLSMTKRLDQTGTKQSYTFHGSVDQNV